MGLSRSRHHSRTPNMVHNSSGKPILIIGAGLAGLASAYELAKNGQKVVILEARDRLGGRVETLRKPFSDNHVAEAGASWLNDRHNIAMGYILEFGLGNELKHVPLSGKPLFYHIKKTSAETRFLPNEPWLNSMGLHDGEKKMGLGGILSAVFCDISLLGNPAQKDWPPPPVRQKYGSMTFEEFLQSPHWSSVPHLNKVIPYISSQGAIEMIRPWFAWWDEDFRKISALSMIEYGSLGLGISADRAHISKWFMAKNGMDFLPRAFAQELENIGVTILKNSPVTSIKQTNSSISLCYVLPSGKSETVEGNYAICTIPLPTLKKIKVEPKLSDGKWKLINEIQYASVSRAYVQGKKNFIDLKNSVGFTDLAIGNLMDMSYYHAKGPGKLLQSFMIGKQARNFSKKTNTSKKKFMVEEINKIFPNFTIDNIDRFTHKCWDDDPWSCGAYPMFTPDQFLSRGELSKAEGLLHFAGEHTSEYTTWIEGALRSGQRAAAEVLSLIWRKQ